MMKVVALAALAGSAAAFAPAQVGRTATEVGATAAQKDFFGIRETDFSKELGVQPPVSLVMVIYGMGCFWSPILKLSYLTQESHHTLCISLLFIAWILRPPRTPKGW